MNIEPVNSVARSSLVQQRLGKGLTSTNKRKNLILKAINSRDELKVLSVLKSAVNRILALLDHRVDRTSVIPRVDTTISHLEHAGLRPATVFDIGVADGTPWIYEAWPNAKYFLFDPTPQSLPHMEAWAKKLDARIFNVALGDTTGRITLHIRPDHSGSTIYQEVGKVRVSESRDVPLNRFDEMVTTSDFRRPSLAKIDVQGAEIEVLKGMGNLIKQIDCIIVETSLLSTLQGSPEFSDVVVLMKDRGFVLFDIVGILRRPLDHAMAQIDAVFVPEESPLRSDRRWNVAET